MCGHPLEGMDRNKGRQNNNCLSGFLKATHRAFYFTSTSTHCLKECGEIGCNGWKTKEKKAGKDHFYHVI